jgi:hypothetical protein
LPRQAIGVDIDGDAMTDSAADLGKFVPGFDFLQTLVKGAGAALPSIGQWVAPTLDPEEIDKRIEELRTVQFWLEQNARMLSATIQALEVQRMTLSTLRTMNVQMSDLRDSMMIRTPAAEPPQNAAPSWARAAEPEPEPEFDEEPADEALAAAEPEPAAVEAAHEPRAEAAPAAAVVDPMQWWGALTKQFTELAAAAMQESVPKPAVPQGAAARPGSAPAAPAKKTPKAAAKKPRNPRAAARKRAPAAASTPR